MRLSDSLKLSVMQWLRGTDMPSAPDALELAVSTTDPGEDGSTITEPTDATYERQPLTLDTPDVGVDATTAASDALITFGPATVGFGTLTHAAVFEVGGAMLLHGPLPAPVTIGAGQPLSFPIGAVIAGLR